MVKKVNDDSIIMDKKDKGYIIILVKKDKENINLK